MIRSRIMLQSSVIIGTLIISLMFAVMPVTQALAAWRPEWPLLAVMYWIIALPHRINIGHAFLVGLAVDVLLGSTFGFHALAYSVVVYPAARYYPRIRNFSLVQQTLLILFLVCLARVLVFALEHNLNNAQFIWSYFLPVLTSALFWPWVFLIFRKIRRRFQMV